MASQKPKYRIFISVMCLTLTLALIASPCRTFQATQSFSIGGSTITVHVAPDTPPVPMTAVMNWVQNAATAVTAYEGRFPVPQYDIRVDTSEGGQIHHGVTYDGRRTTITLGQDTDEKDLTKDWEMTHEMLHLAFPQLDQQYDWMGEGLSDYIEPIARARVGQLSAEEVWRQLVQGLPQGLPEPGDQGLDHTHTWGRTYWGGTLYWFLADLEIRRQTQERRSIRDALQAILQAGGNGQEEWTLERTLSMGDQATGTRVLHELHDRMGSKPYDPDLPSLWKRLGVIYTDGHVTFNNHAPDASLRKAITAS